MSWTFAGVVKRMFDKRQTGVLLVISADGELRVHLNEGTIVNLEAGEGLAPYEAPGPLREVLLHSGTVDLGELRRLERRAAKRQEPLEALLVRTGTLTEEVLGRFLDLCARETLLELFSRSGITCQLLEERPRPSPYLSPVPIPWLLKSARRRAEQWPDLRKAIPDEGVIFDKVDAHVGEVLGGDAADLTAADRTVYYYVDGVRTAQQVALAACLGEFETWVALSRLKKQGRIRPTGRRGSGEPLRARRVVLPGVIRGLAWGGAALLVAALIVFRPGALSEPEALAAPLPPDLAAALRHHQSGRLDKALEIHRALHGRYPASISALAEAQLLPRSEAAALSRAFRLHLATDGRSYALEQSVDVWH